MCVCWSFRPTPPIPRKRKNVEIVRDEIKLKDQEARADIIIKKDENGDPVKLGWITLPSFYADMDKHQKSTTRDVLALLKRLKKENIAGLVVDLRKKWRRLTRRSDLAHRTVFEVRPDRADQGSNGTI